MIPIGDTPRPAGTPLITYLLIAANVAIYVFVCLPLTVVPPSADDPNLQLYLEFLSSMRPASPAALAQSISAYDLFMFSHGFRPDAPSLMGLLGSMFLHANMGHLGGNMVFLWVYGDNVEMRVGRRTYLTIYLLTGIVATLGFALFAGDTRLPLLGASGAISGVLGCYFVWFPHNRVRLLLPPPFLYVAEVPARFVLGFYLLADNVAPLLFGHAGGGGVAYGAHVGGFVSGTAFAWWLQHRPAGMPTPLVTVFGGVPAPEVGPMPPPLRSLLEQQEFAAAAKRYAELSHADYGRVRPDDLLELGDWLTEEGQAPAALRLFQRIIATRSTPAALQDEAQRTALAQAHLRAGYLQLRVWHNAAVAEQHLQTVLALQPIQRLQMAARQALLELRQAAAGPQQ